MFSCFVDSIHVLVSLFLIGKTKIHTKNFNTEY
ncbi:hypothetical protein ACB092_05G107600 [Castanea dentata]